MVDAKPLSLNDMTRLADRIFVGTVRDIQVSTEALSERRQTENAEVRNVTIAVSEGVKGVETGATITVNQTRA